MSFLSDLFNRKEQMKDLEEPRKNAVFTEVEEEELEEEEPEEFTQENKRSVGADSIDFMSEEHNDAEVEEEIVEREILPAKIICPDCGGITLEGLEFCDKCGGEL